MAEERNNRNKGKKPVKIRIGISWFYVILLMGIAYMFFSQNGASPQKIEWDEVEVLDETERGEGGFGSTGK